MSRQDAVEGGVIAITATRPMVVLVVIGEAAHASARRMPVPELATVIRSASSPWSGITSITAYFGGKTATRDGVLMSLPWLAFGAELADYAQEVVETKGAGAWFTPALTKDGRCRDEDVEGITQLSLDADDVGDWWAMRQLLVASDLAHAVQRSSSHSAERPKWHAHIPLATPWVGSKAAWRRVYRHAVAWWSAAADLAHDLKVHPPQYGFDRCVDRLGQPWFLAARRSARAPVPETVCLEGSALDLERFMQLTNFDLARAEATATASKTNRHGRRSRSTLVGSPASGTFPADAEGLLVMAFREAGKLGVRVGANKHAVVCPWQSAHTTGTLFDSSTVVFAPSTAGGLGGFHCCHSHCEGKGPREVLAALPSPAVARALAIMQQRTMTKLGIVNARLVPNRIVACSAGASVRGRR
jgi:hypothetical protein